MFAQSQTWGGGEAARQTPADNLQTSRLLQPYSHQTHTTVTATMVSPPIGAEEGSGQILALVKNVGEIEENL